MSDDKAALCEHALLALSFAEAVIDGNRVNQTDVLGMATDEQLIAGFCYLIGSMRLSLAAAAGGTPAEVDAAIRALLMVGAS